MSVVSHPPKLSSHPTMWCSLPPALPSRGVLDSGVIPTASEITGGRIQYPRLTTHWKIFGSPARVTEPAVDPPSLPRPPPLPYSGPQRTLQAEGRVGAGHWCGKTQKSLCTLLYLTNLMNLTGRNLGLAVGVDKVGLMPRQQKQQLGVGQMSPRPPKLQMTF